MKNKVILLAVSLCMIFALALCASAETVGYISHNGGASANDGLTETTPKNALGAANGTGAAGVLKNGGTLVVVEKMYIGANYKWNVGGDTTITAVYGGKDYRNPSPATDPKSGVIKFKPNITWTIASNVTLDNIIIFMDATIAVAEGTSLVITDSVQTMPRSGNYSSITVARGARAEINSGTYKSIEGMGDIVIGKNVTVLEGENATVDAPAVEDTPAGPSVMPTVSVSGPVAYMSHNKGNNSNDGLSDKSPKSGWGSVSGTGIASVVKNGGTVVSCEKMYLGADYTWNVGGKTLITATYGKDYRNAEPANNPVSGVLKFKPNVKFIVASDLTFDNIILHQEATIHLIAKVA